MCSNHVLSTKLIAVLTSLCSILAAVVYSTSAFSLPMISLERRCFYVALTFSSCGQAIIGVLLFAKNKHLNINLLWLIWTCCNGVVLTGVGLWGFFYVNNPIYRPADYQIDAESSYSNMPTYYFFAGVIMFTLSLPVYLRRNELLREKGFKEVPLEYSNIAII